MLRVNEVVSPSNPLCPSGMSSLHWAVDGGHIDMVLHILDQGVPVKPFKKMHRNNHSQVTVPPSYFSIPSQP